MAAAHAPRRAACCCLGATPAWPVAAQATLAAAAAARRRATPRRAFVTTSAAASSVPPPPPPPPDGGGASDDAQQTAQEPLPPRAPLIKPPPRRPPLGAGGVSGAPTAAGASAGASPRAPPLHRAFAPRETLSFSIAGVTFKERQAAVRAAAPGAPLLLLREPENAVDAHAVAVLDLSGARLGFVPRALTAAFAAADCAAGRVGETGVNEAGVAWATAQARPAGPAALAALHPAGAPPPPLRAALGDDAWAALAAAEEAEKQEAGGVCAGCGACSSSSAAAAQGAMTEAEAERLAPLLTATPVAPRPAWRFDPAARVATLAGLLPLCDACDAVARLPDASSSESGDAGADAAAAATSTDDALLAHLSAVNAWSREQAAAYMAWVRRERARRAALGAWRVDASWLRRARRDGRPLLVDEGTLAALEARTQQ
jgi:hypothetical protein